MLPETGTQDTDIDNQIVFFWKTMHLPTRLPDIGPPSNVVKTKSSSFVPIPFNRLLISFTNLSISFTIVEATAILTGPVNVN